MNRRSTLSKEAKPIGLCIRPYVRLTAYCHLFPASKSSDVRNVSILDPALSHTAHVTVSIYYSLYGAHHGACLKLPLFLTIPQTAVNVHNCSTATLLFLISK